jgi:tRNA threonylcarbamoyladenosine biosynthesis protein TsaB
MDARMDEIYAARYRFSASHWQVLDAPRLITPEALNERWRVDAPQCIAGTALAAFGARLQVGDVTLRPRALPRAVAMLPLAQALWDSGGAVDAALALPLYLRDKVAQTTLERESARALKAAMGAAS